MSENIYFLSDAHLGSESPQKEGLKEKKLLTFLDFLVREKANSLYIVGDLFDFWFEYRKVIPQQYFPIISKLYEVTSNSIQVTYLLGNHDYWLGSFFSQYLGVKLFPAPLEITLQEKRLYIAHGDGLSPGDYGYQILKKIFRSQVNIFLYSLIHPDLGIALAKRVSRFSRNHISKVFSQMECPLLNFAKEKWKEGYDYVVLGHSHHPLYLQEDKKVYLNVGDWMTHFTYGKLEGGKLTLESWK